MNHSVIFRYIHFTFYFHNMSERYSKNGVHTFENVVGHLAQSEEQVHPLGSIGGYEWKLGLRVYDETDFRTSLICGNDNPKVKIGIRYYLKIKNSNEILQEKFKREDFTNLESDSVVISKYIPHLEVLNLKNGWLNDGKCTLEYGIQVEFILGYDDVGILFLRVVGILFLRVFLSLSLHLIALELGFVPFHYKTILLLAILITSSYLLSSLPLSHTLSPTVLYSPLITFRFLASLPNKTARSLLRILLTLSLYYYLLQLFPTIHHPT
ncbi:hypothetical protein CRE_00975 [Caenorhabditis remanei]|uniref:MATH domain-containing protein n=1 Tax=Caenorhabditis remanei TaxID=31234 RepID=E3MIA3_CAERE|nr:hypothetical protein CRE_00975 [Caenorhabditis remanei]